MLRAKTLLRRNSVLQRYASSLVVAEHDGAVLSAGTLSTITAASKIGGDISVLVLGKGLDAVAKNAAGVAGVTKVLVAENDALVNSMAEDVAAVVTQVAKKHTHILAASTNNGKNFMPRAAAILDSSPLSDILAVVDENTFKRPMYAGNAIATMKMTNAHKFLLVRPTAFEKAGSSGSAAPIEAVTLETPVTKSPLSTFLGASVTKSERPDLTAARVVISGGRGMKSAENFALLDSLADKLGGAVGASRAAVDAGYAPNEYQVGQTGKVVAPDLYIAVGISGAIQHLSGMKDSKTIVAINKDKEAPIFAVADFGLVEDLFKAVPEMTSKL
eukprot:CAMPEP_0184974218 /NCGR_PEP_ID=MMETSP1098-20130426/5755_1 /TAXON_ID=89044 /ORGANISM="Spumella elongata, Strain CCAP 955/1" /LENGTH=329 /DNA_ID=CAMNT_0027496763 /DNA_START=24 /DNA_END=1013 /DNA_ORIENTATION=-